MRQEQHEHRSFSPSPSSSHGAHRLVVLNHQGDSYGYAHTYYSMQYEGMSLIAVPRMRLEWLPTMMLVSGMGVGRVFEQIYLAIDGEEPVPGAFIGGMPTLWRNGEPDLIQAGFLYGARGFNVELAVRGIAQLFMHFR